MWNDRNLTKTYSLHIYLHPGKNIKNNNILNVLFIYCTLHLIGEEIQIEGTIYIYI